MKDLGIRMGMDVVRREAQHPVGGRLAHFDRNGERVSTDPWVLETISGSNLGQYTPQQSSRPGGILLDAEKTQAL